MRVLKQSRVWQWSMAVIFVLGSMAAGQAKAEEDAMMASPSPTPSLTWKGVFQAQDNLTNNGGNQNLSLAHVRVSGTWAIDAEDTLVVMPDYGSTGFTLLDAYGLHQFSDVKGLSVQAGQFKVAFGDNRYLTPGQLKRTGYNAIDALIPGGATAKAWDLGLEVKEQVDQFSIQADAIQGAGPDVVSDNNNTIDYAARAEWKDPNFILGVSDYYGEGGQGATYTYSSFQNWFGAHGRLMIESLDLRAEAVFAPGSANGYDAQVSIKPVSWFEPLAWYETILTNNTATTNNLGAGVNLWAGAKTRVSLDVSFIGLTDILSANSETLQFEEVF